MRRARSSPPTKCFVPGKRPRARRATLRSVEIWADAARSTLNGWYEAGLVSREVSASPALQARVRARGKLRAALRPDTQHRRT